jgi:hypothetical protein
MWKITKCEDRVHKGLYTFNVYHTEASGSSMDLSTDCLLPLNSVGHRNLIKFVEQLNAAGIKPLYHSFDNHK